MHDIWLASAKDRTSGTREPHSHTITIRGLARSIVRVMCSVYGVGVSGGYSSHKHATPDRYTTDDGILGTIKHEIFSRFRCVDGQEIVDSVVLPVGVYQGTVSGGRCFIPAPAGISIENRHHRTLGHA